MSKNRFNAIVILDAIPEGELNTARLLRENLKDIANFVIDGLHVFYYRIETMDCLEHAISDLIRKNREAEIQPWLHLDGHGLIDESGFVFAGGTHCNWSELKNLITPLNVAMGLNLMLIMATCHGGSFVKAIRTTDRAPIWGLIGPVQKVTIGQIEASFPAFYQAFFESYSSSKALKVLNESSPVTNYYVTTADHFFYEVWKSYKENHCSKRMIKKRASLMYQKAKSKNLYKIPSIGEFKRMLSDRSKEKHLFEKYRDNYFMYDLHPSNRNRFPVTYEEAEVYISG